MIVVVPCYNEAGRLDADRFRRFAAAHDGVQFLFVNDGSTDGTLPLLEGLRDADPARFSVCHFPVNQGKAEAVRRGFLEAFSRTARRGSAPEYVAFWDADLATPLDAIGRFAAVLDERPDVEIVVGTRIPLLGRKIRRAARRRWLGRLFSAVASQMLGLGIYDTQCGAKMFRVSPQIEALFHEPFSTRWIFDVEILARLIAARRRAPTCGCGWDTRRTPRLQQVARAVIYEMPLESWEEKGGSKLKGRDFVKAVFELAVIWRKNLLGVRWPAAEVEPDVLSLPPRLQDDASEARRKAS